MLLLLFVVVILLFIRAMWEHLSPINPDDFKGLIYFRDVVILFPASFILIFTLLKYGNFTLSWFTSIFPVKLISLKLVQKKWRLIMLFMALMIFCMCTLINIYAFKTCAHIVDEANYLFQGKVFAGGNLTASPPLLSKDFFEIKYFIQSSNDWYGSFFPGQSVLLAIGVLLKCPYLINPCLTAILLVTTVWAGRRIFSTTVGLFAGFLLLCSPFVLFQGASYFSHISSAILVTITLVWLLKLKDRQWLKTLGCGIMTGALFLFRPLSAVVLIIFWLSYFVYQHIKHKSIPFATTFKLLLLFGLGLFLGVILLFGYNYSLTGHHLTTPHNIVLPNENICFGVHSLKNTAINIIGLSVDLFGIPLLSLIPVVLFFLSSSKYSNLFLVFSVLYCLAYSIYPFHGLSYGPRFYFELVPILLIGSSHVLLDESSFSNKRVAKFLGPLSKRIVIFTLIITVLFISFLGVIPGRLAVFSKRGEYYDIRNIVRKAVSTPAIVSIMSSDKDRIIPYLAGFQLNSPMWDGDIIFVRYLPYKKENLVHAYPERRHYILDMDKRIVIPDN